MFDRFDIEFQNTSENLGLITHGQEDIREAKINCSQMSQLFLNLGFVGQEGKDDEQILLANIWKMVGGDQDGKEEVSLQHIKVVMCAIQNFHIDWLIDHEREDQGLKPTEIGRFEEGYMFLNSDEIQHITKKNILLYMNRQTKISTEKKTIH